MTEPAAAALAARVHRSLLERGMTCATAESLTGGLIGAHLTSVPGASATYRGGVVVYATDTKASLLGVPEDLLAAEGAVHPGVAEAMAAGVRRLLGADFGLAVTGVAGPEPQDGRPVGTVYAGLAGPDGNARALLFRFTGDRSGIRYRTVEGALELLDSAVHGDVAGNTRP
ncbi:CinA family protein [Nocardiopsis changdeensis]|uniref:Nicotinamide-nucleotide amidohydrolase family protein n=1 Tax=Nocardiopsis changdeensis TaxID=2831969 RepID=A0ABX8BJJ5_9ACTN|nr:MULTISPECIES: nicotinamide-nucleotide amidohydrolase family protein [Nocardiopsis]QUX21464.1 nicotinamide-nucleotide amidohydrolase family protein [Nocardiopsis changdeensis]QYX37397.1 nicotinamide-nucleotide amidohydrolase family protein [Nocardiopsis sp. MT53]